METYQRLLIENKAWAQEVKQHNPNFFTNLAEAQNPDFLWIGCSDSRVPANTVTNSGPGEIFVHRNIANLVLADDSNALSVIQYAVNHLLVPHVIICGHYNCGGVKTAYEHLNQPFKLGRLGNWLDNIKAVYSKHQSTLDAIEDETERLNAFVETNVKEQINNLAQTDIIQDAWAKRQAPILHGWVYGLNNGIIKELITVSPPS